MLLKKNKQKRIAFLYPEGTIDTVPCLMSSIYMLNQKGYIIDLYILTNKKYHMPFFKIKNVNIYSVKLFNPKLMYKLWFFSLPLWFLYILKNILSNSYVCIIGVDPLGMLAATAAGILKKVPRIYFSIEIFIARERNIIGAGFLKKMEIWSNKKHSFSIIQDRNRADLLIKNNHINKKQIILLPNSSLGKARKKKSDYLQKKFSIPIGKKIILYAGSITDWSMSLEIVESARFWPDNTVLVMHTRRMLDNDKYTLSIKKHVDNSKIIISDEPVPLNELEELIASADIGIALYKIVTKYKTNTNLTTIGLSSGKIAQYLKCGVPVITIDFPDLKKLINKYQCGICIKNAAEIGGAITAILKNQNNFILNSVACYNNKFEFSQPFTKIINEIDKL